MQLQGRDLKIDICGKDVALLQDELAQLGYTIPRGEREGELFRPGTAAAVVDERTATAMGLAREGRPLPCSAVGNLPNPHNLSVDIERRIS
jgi:hypothetical protein